MITQTNEIKIRCVNLAIAVVSLGFVVYVGIQLFDLAAVPFNGIHVTRLKSDAARRIPLGCSRQQVEHWLASWKIAAWKMTDRNGQLSGFGANFPNDSFWESPAEIRIRLLFDEHDRLKKRIIYRFVYSL